MIDTLNSQIVLFCSEFYINSYTGAQPEDHSPLALSSLMVKNQQVLDIRVFWFDNANHKHTLIS